MPRFTSVTASCRQPSVRPPRAIDVASNPDAAPASAGMWRNSVGAASREINFI